MKVRINLGVFYSPGDERRFFAGFSGNPAIAGVCGMGQQLELTLIQRHLNHEALRDLIALLWRYHIPLSPLSPLANGARFTWLSDEKWYWHQSMFDERGLP